MYSYEELLNVIAQLRGEHGCPWDKAQTHESLIPCLRNECEEVVQAIEQHDEENLCEELGDVLLQVLLHARIAEEEGQFTMADVVNGLAEKMVRRHPHVFGNEEYGSPEQNQARWEEIKRQEKEAKKRRKLAENQGNLIDKCYKTRKIRGGNKDMNKAELIAAVAENAELTKKDAEKAVKAFIDVVTDELKKGEKVQVVGFGTFEVAERAAREGRNPHTGEPMPIAASKAPKFKAGKALKDALN